MPTLAEQLTAQKEGFLKNAPPEIVKTMGEALARLKASDILKGALKSGDAAPLFDLPDAKGQTVSLKEKLQQGPAVITFYRGVW